VGDTAELAAESGALAAEQGYLEQAYEYLAGMEVRAQAATDDAAARAPGDWDATVAHRFLSHRVASMSATAGPLCFGRIDEELGPAWHIGRRHVEDDQGHPVVVDWRAPVSVPFYRATFMDPLGLDRRRRFILDGRRLADLVDEDFHDPHAEALASATGLPDPLLAELGRARTGAMRDIVSTIAAEQDRIIRAPLDAPIVVQGGPGTGKTAVGLHRAAWLLYEHRSHLERYGALVLGPNRVFLAYISEVLPSLGEVAVAQTTLAGLCPDWRVKATEPAEAAALKGDGRMAGVVERAFEAGLQAPAGGLGASTRWGAVRVWPDKVAELLQQSLMSGGPFAERRSRFRRAVAREMMGQLARRRFDLEANLEEVQGELAKDRAFQTALGKVWPAQSPVAIVRGLYGKPMLLGRAAGGCLSAGEMALLRRKPGRSLGDEPWTEADLPLLDEARSFLTGPPRRYGHVVVDEAQDLSAMALRMVARRSMDGRSFTVLGDLAQATAPGAPGDWRQSLSALGNPAGAEIEELTVGYRVPGEIMDVANRVLAFAAPHLRPTESARSTGRDPTFVSASSAELADAAVGVAAELLSSYGSVALVTPPDLVDDLRACLAAHEIPLVPYEHASLPGHVALILPEMAKGLEFDAVVVVEPTAILAIPGGAGLLYISLTRAVQELAVVYSGDLPAILAPEAA
jgi:DNA helicase IV